MYFSHAWKTLLPTKKKTPICAKVLHELKKCFTRKYTISLWGSWIYHHASNVFKFGDAHYFNSTYSFSDLCFSINDEMVDYSSLRMKQARWSFSYMFILLCIQLIWITQNQILIWNSFIDILILFKIYLHAFYSIPFFTSIYYSMHNLQFTVISP